MFSYLGSKSKLASLYPAPKFGRIIEPFAGSARYSLLHFENDVDLYDLNPMIIDIWKYLIEASEKDIRSLPDMPSKVHIDSIKGLTQTEKNLIGFSLCRGKAKPRKVGHGQNSWNRDRERIASNLYKIRHWKVALKSFEKIRNARATHFIDPPYKLTVEGPNTSDRYPFWQINYKALGEYARSRRGLVIACEGSRAGYLPFRLLTETRANTNNREAKISKEFIYLQEDGNRLSRWMPGKDLC